LPALENSNILLKLSKLISWEALKYLYRSVSHLALISSSPISPSIDCEFNGDI